MEILKELTIEMGFMTITVAVFDGSFNKLIEAKKTYYMDGRESKITARTVDKNEAETIKAAIEAAEKEIKRIDDDMKKIVNLVKRVTKRVLIE